jgi:DNA-binding NarL/FixJ family response regulator
VLQPRTEHVGPNLPWASIMQNSSEAGVSPLRCSRARVVIADDHKLVAEAFKRLLEPEFDVVGVFPDARTLMQSLDELRPDVVILDVVMPQLNGLDAGAEIKRRNQALKLIYVTMLENPDVAAEAFRRGASGYLVKQCSAEELPLAVRCVLRGQSYLCPLIAHDTIEFLLQAPTEPCKVSARQAEILQLLAEGKQMKEIGHLLQITTHTVACHMYKIMQKLGVATSAALIEYAGSTAHARKR